METIGGIDKIVINGKTFAVKSGVEISVNTVIKESVVGLDGTHGIKQMHRPASLSFTTTKDKNFDIESLTNEKLNIVVFLADGYTYKMLNATLVGEVNYSAEEGEINLTFNSEKIIYE